MNGATIIAFVAFVILGLLGGWFWPVVAIGVGCVGFLSLAILDGRGKSSNHDSWLVTGVCGGAAICIYAASVAIYKASLALIGGG